MSTRRLSFAVHHRYRSENLLTLRLVNYGAAILIEVVGDLDMTTTHQLTELTEAVLRGHSPRVIILDLTGLRFFCAHGIRALLHIRDTAAAQSARLVLRDPPPNTRLILEITDASEKFEIQPGLANT